MVAFIFGIILLVIGIGGGIALSVHKTEEYKEDSQGRYVRDTNGDRVIITQHPLRKFSWIGYAAGIFLFVVLLFVGSTVSVATGHTGVVTVFGRVEDSTFDAGFHLKAPWQTVTEMDNRVQKATVELECFSSDLQEVKCKYTLNYQIDKANAQTIYRTIGINYYDIAITPDVSESVKTVVAKYTAEQLIGNRETLAKGIEDDLEAKLAKRNIELVTTAIEDLDFTDAFTNAVEEKQVAAQNKLKAEIQQEQAVKQAEADARVAKTKADADAEVSKIKANAEAEVVKIQANADLEVQKINADAAEYTGRKEAAKLDAIGEVLKTHPELVDYVKTLEWDGKLPEYLVLSDGTVLPILGSVPTE